MGPLGSCCLNMAKGKKFFSSPKCSLSYPDFCSVCTGSSVPEHEADKLLPSSAKVKKEWSYTSTPTYAFTVHMGSLYLQLWLSWSITSFSLVLGDDSLWAACLCFIFGNFCFEFLARRLTDWRLVSGFGWEISCPGCFHIWARRLTVRTAFRFWPVDWFLDFYQETGCPDWFQILVRRLMVRTAFRFWPVDWFLDFYWEIGCLDWFQILARRLVVWTAFSFGP